MEGPCRATLKPALAAEDRREARGCRHVAGGAALAQVGEEQARACALAHSIQPARRLTVADVAHGLTQVRRVAELLQFDSAKWRAVLATAVKDHRQVAMSQGHLTQLWA